jgi:N-acetylglutamate synthase-like GNAT family acetyltransferase
MTVETIVEGKSGLCRSILQSLPDWFAIPESIERYAAEAEHHQMFGVRQDSAVIGFATVEMLNPHVAEIHVIAVRQANHRRGIGRALVGRCVQHCRDAGVEMLLVKTRAATGDDPQYAATRGFYMAMGFRPLLESDTFWGADDPCLLMGKVIRR